MNTVISDQIEFLTVEILVEAATTDLSKLKTYATGLLHGLID